jgi:hypothetical protein
MRISKECATTTQSSNKKMRDLNANGYVKLSVHINAKKTLIHVMNWGSSAGIITDYGLGDSGSIPGRC